MNQGPKCLCCNKPLRKATRTVWIGKATDKIKHTDQSSHLRHVYLPEAERPTTLQQCQRLSNWQVVSIRKGYGGTDADRVAVGRFAEWDGESYESRFGYFCSVSCAATYGRRAAERETFAQRASAGVKRVIKENVK
jgi:hypothetical protein